MGVKARQQGADGRLHPRDQRQFMMDNVGTALADCLDPIDITWMMFCQQELERLLRDGKLQGIVLDRLNGRDRRVQVGFRGGPSRRMVTSPVIASRSNAPAVRMSSGISSWCKKRVSWVAAPSRKTLNTSS